MNWVFSTHPEAKARACPRLVVPCCLDSLVLVVESVHVDLDQVRTIGVLTAPVRCSVRSSRSKAWVSTRPRDIRIGPGIPRIVRRKRKWLCTNSSCGRESLTESVPQVPPRGPMAVRAKAEIGVGGPR